MNNGEACAIFHDIKRDDKTIEEKAWAIHQVCTMPTHNSITKKQMIDVIIWLWHMCFEMADAQDVLQIGEDKE